MLWGLIWRDVSIMGCGNPGSDISRNCARRDDVDYCGAVVDQCCDEGL